MRCWPLDGKVTLLRKTGALWPKLAHHLVEGDPGGWSGVLDDGPRGVSDGQRRLSSSRTHASIDTARGLAPVSPPPRWNNDGTHWRRKPAGKRRRATVPAQRCAPCPRCRREQNTLVGHRRERQQTPVLGSHEELAVVPAARAVLRARNTTDDRRTLELLLSRAGPAARDLVAIALLDGLSRNCGMTIVVSAFTRAGR